MSLTREVHLDTEEGYASVLLQCDDEEAMRVAQIMKFPWSPNCKVSVRLDCEPLTDENCYLNSTQEGGDARQYSLLEGRDVHDRAG